MPYQRYLTKDSIPFNPIELAKETEKIVSRNNERKYTSFYCTGVYGGISTGYLVGCCLRCIFCWVDPSRDFPERYGKFYSAEEVFNLLDLNARRKGIKKLRISGGEPTLCKQHLLELLKLIDKTDYFFVLETNGILIGNDPDYAKELAEFKNIYVRVSIKAGTAEGFEKRTGALGSYYELPYKGVESLLKNDVFVRAASMSDPRLMPAEERNEMIKKLESIDRRIAIDLEEEQCDPYPNTIERLRFAEVELGW